jgi:hypothetical protein
MAFLQIDELQINYTDGWNSSPARVASTASVLECSDVSLLGTRHNLAVILVSFVCLWTFAPDYKFVVECLADQEVTSESRIEQSCGE